MLGAGLVTGASDDDPSGIATYSQAGARYGFELGWTLILTYPLMVAIQAIAARIGRTTGMGIAGVLRKYYSSTWLQLIVLLLLIANTLNIGADLGAMAEAVRLIAPHAPAWALVIGFGLISTLAQVFLQHTRYVAVLKWLTLSLLTYFAALAMVKVSWHDFFAGLFWPRFEAKREFWMMIIAILGTTISPYLFFWQAAQEVEDTKEKPKRAPLRRAPAQAPTALARIRVDTLVGMGFSNLVALAILATAASTLHANGTLQISDAAQAAQALKPVGGSLAFTLFTLGIVGTGLLSIPVLAGSAAYAVGEARHWPVGLSRNVLEAKAFYSTIALATLAGALANALSVKPMVALVWVAVLNGIVAVPVMILMMKMSVRTDIMGKFPIGRSWRILGWSATAVMALATLIFIVSLIHQ